MEKILNFLEKIGLIKSDYFDIFKSKSEIKVIKTKDKLLKFVIHFINPILPKIYFKLLSDVKTLDGSVLFEIKNRFNSFESLDVAEYLIYYVQNNSFSEKIILQNILKRKTCIVENHILYLCYINQNELYILEKYKNQFKSFLDRCDFDIDSIDFKLDVITKNIQNFKKEQEEQIKNAIIQTTNLVKNTNSTKNNSTDIKRNKGFVSNVSKISDLFLEMQVALIEGEIFHFEKVTTKNNFIIYKIYITDYSGSISLRVFPKEKGVTKEYLNSLKNGLWVKVKISLQIDTYDDNSLSGIINTIEIINKPQRFIRNDNSVNKRVEFITHSIMTAFEGLVDVEELFSLLKSFGHKSIAITDKSNCQSFPIAMNLAKKYDINVIYGTQLEIINNPIDIVLNPSDKKISDQTYVIFDLETTGLSPYYDRIIEFGAIKYKINGEIEKMQMFINPEIDIPSNISAITKITNEHVKDALTIKPSLEKIIEFLGDSVLIAHNGIKFDFPFLNCKLVENGFEPLKNTLIDTMQISRSINVQINSHSLGSICRKLKINYDENEAHRADVDSEFLLEVWKVMKNKFESDGIVTFNDINFKLQNNLIKERNRGYWASIYCLKENNIRELYKLISSALTTNYFGGAKTHKEILDQYREYILISNSPTEGELIDKAMNNTNDELISAIQYYDFITICPISCFAHQINRKVYSEKDLINATKRIIDISLQLNKKIVASSDTYYLNKVDKEYFNVYVHTKSIGGKRHRFYKYDGTNDVMPDLHYRSTDEMIDELNFIGDKQLIEDIVINYPNQIAELFDKNISPIKNQLYSPSIPGASESFKDKIWENAKAIYGEKINEYILDRINHEINSIINHGYSMIYWFSHLLVKKSMDDGFVVGSRGSVGSSIAAWLLNISEVNPLKPHYLCMNCKYLKFEDGYESGFDLPEQKCPCCNSNLIGDGHNIPFETFMGFKGDKIPDIDLNFSAVYQSKAHEFIREMFGKDKVLRAGTISTVASKTAFGYVKSYFESINKTDVSSAEVMRVAKRCENVKRTTGQHPGGIIVIPSEYDVYDFTPINYPADDTSIDWFTTHFAFEHLHDTLLKFDILGHDNPTVLKMLTEQTGVHPNDIPNYDKDVMNLFSNVESLKLKYDDNINDIFKVGTNGIPEFGTNFVKEMLLVTRPQKFSDLIRISGLSHGTNVWNDNAKTIIEEEGVKISEVISCRDDIMVFLIKKGVESLTAFKIMEDVRKGKGLKDEYLDILKKVDIEPWYIKSCQKISYLFPKAHATAYVIMAWKIAWFKIHYPLHFYSSYLSIRRDVFDLETIISGKNSVLSKMMDIKNRMNDSKTKALVKNKEIDLLPIYEIVLEMFCRGFSIKNIDLNRSLENDFIVEKDYLIAPFSTIDGLGESVAKSIVEARNEKPFVSKDDLLNRTKITKTHFKILNDLGVLSHLDDDEQLTLF